MRLRETVQLATNKVRVCYKFCKETIFDDVKLIFNECSLRVYSKYRVTFREERVISDFDRTHPLLSRRLELGLFELGMSFFIGSCRVDGSIDLFYKDEISPPRLGVV